MQHTKYTKLGTIFVLTLSLLLMGCTANFEGSIDLKENSNTDSSNTNTNTNNQQGASDLSGRVVFTVTDAAADMGAVSDVEMTISDVQVYSESQGWVKVSSESQTYHLLELRDEERSQLMADANLKQDTYTKVKINVDSVVVVDNEGRKKATMPNNELEFESTVKSQTDATSQIEFDVLADQSLHLSKEGDYVMAPVIAVEAKEEVQVDSSNENDVKTSGGKVTTKTTVGMDINGNVGVGLNIDANAAISVSAGVVSVANSAVSVISDTSTSIDTVADVAGDVGVNI